VSLGWGVDEGTLLANVGLQLPVDQDRNSTVLFYNLQFARPLGGRLTPFVALNGYHYTQEGDGEGTVKLGNGARLTLSQVQQALGLQGFEALDYANLGSDNVKHNDVITWAFGLRWRFSDRLSAGLVYERPLTRRKDVLQQRVTVNLLFEI
jgi:hemolysin activation/secretion protein